MTSPRGKIPIGLALLLAAALAVCASASGAKTGAGAKASASRPAKSGAKRTRHSKRRERGQTAPTPDRVSEIQQALAKEGSFAGAPNGKWDNSTAEAMRKFQSGHGLNPTGKLDAPTLQKLGLGSKTSGIAPPVGPANSSSLLTAPNTISTGEPQ